MTDAAQDFVPFPNGAPSELVDDVNGVASAAINSRPDERFSGDDTLPVFDLRKLDGPEPPELEFILPGFIPKGEVGLFTGEGGVGKSLLAQQLANCAATGTSFVGHAVPSDGSATLYVTCEEGEAEMHRRQKRVMQSLGLTSADIHDLVFLSSLRGDDGGTELIRFDADGEGHPTQAYRRLSETVATAYLDFVILDNVAHLFGGNENDRRQVTAFVNLLYRLVKRERVTVLLIGHPNKSGDAYSGNTAWLNAMRFHIHMRRVTDENGFAVDPDQRVLEVGKANYSRLGRQTQFRWHNHAFICEDDLPPDTRKELATAQRAASENQIFLECLRVRREQSRDVGPSIGPNYAPAQFERMTEAKGLKKPALTRAMERLFHTGKIEVCEVKREGKGGTKTIIAEVDGTAPERSPERAPNTDPERTELSDRTTPHTHYISKDITGAAPKPPAPSDDGGVSA